MGMGRLRRTRYLIRDTWQIMGMLRFFLEGHGLFALDYLTGRTPFPTTQELADLTAAISAARTDDLGTLISRVPRFVYEAQAAIESTEKIQQLIARVGGAGRIVEVFVWYKKECPETFAVLEDYYQIGRPGKKPTADALAVDRHISRKTLYRTRDVVLEQIARELARGSRGIKENFVTHSRHKT